MHLSSAMAVNVIYMAKEYPERLLQPDHRIPYEIGGDPDDMMRTDYFMLLSPSVNRDKSWACEHCPNWIQKITAFVSPVIMHFQKNIRISLVFKERKINILFRNQDIGLYEQIVKQANMENISIQDFTKRMLEYCTKLCNKK